MDLTPRQKAEIFIEGVAEVADNRVIQVDWSHEENIIVSVAQVIGLTERLQQLSTSKIENVEVAMINFFVKSDLNAFLTVNWEFTDQLRLALEDGLNALQSAEMLLPEEEYSKAKTFELTTTGSKKLITNES